MLKPLGKNVLLRLPKDEETMKKNEFGIILPDSAKEQDTDMRRVVMAVGPDVENKKLKKDQLVLLTQLSMREKYVSGEDTYEVVKEGDILGLI